MDALLDRLVQTTDIGELRSFLDERLHEQLPGKEARAKAAGILLRVWSGVPDKHFSLRQQAISLLPHITGQERIWLHWGMSVLAYPFFRDVAEVVGRILTLQDDFSGAQVQTRLLTAWGDRSTTRGASQKLLNTFVDWGVLRSTKIKGHFLLARKWTTNHTELQTWLLEALLAASSADEIEAQQLLRVPESFPFALGIGVGELRKHPRFSIYRQGLDMDMVSWRAETLQPHPKPKKRKSPSGKKLIPPQPSLFESQQFGVVLEDGKPSEQRSLAEPSRESTLDTPGATVARVESKQVAPENPFVAQVQECTTLLRGGAYYGCIALSQAIVEAMIHHVRQVKLRTKKSQGSDFRKNVDVLYKRDVLSDELKTNLDKLWSHRSTFHYLSPSVEEDTRQLETLAQDNLKLLNELEQLFFACSIQDERHVPMRPEPWPLPA